MTHTSAIRLEDIKQFEDLAQLPGFAALVNPKDRPLERVVRHYYFPAACRCGLKSCRQPHRDGYIVLLKDGGYTNVGGDCGAHFEGFEAAKNAFTDQFLRPQAMRTIHDLRSRLPQSNRALNTLADRASELNRCNKELARLCPKLHGDLCRMAHSSSSRVVEAIERTEQEIDRLAESSPGIPRDRLRYREEFRGQLIGLRVLTDNLAEIAQFKVEAFELQDLPSVHNLSTSKLLDHERWCKNFASRLHNYEAQVDSGERVYMPDSFRLMTFVAVDAKERSVIATMTKDKLLSQRRDLNQSVRPTMSPPVQRKKWERDLEKKMKAIQRKGGRR